MAMRARSRCSSHCSLRCKANWATSFKLIRMTAPESESSEIWNQPVCQKYTFIGCSIGIRFTFCGLIHQGAPPNGATAVACGHALAAFFLVIHLFVPSGTILQEESDFTSSIVPSPKSTCRQKIIPARNEELYALMARVCTPG